MATYSADALSMKVTSPVPRATWSSLVSADQNAVVSQSLAWHDCVCSNPRVVDVSRLYEFEDGRQLILPMVRHRRVPLRLDMQGSWPRAWGVAGPITPNGRVRTQEARGVLGDVAQIPALATEIQFRHGLEPDWIDEARGFEVLDHTVQLIDLEGGFDQVWSQRFRSSGRTDIRKAERSGLDVRVDHQGQLLPVYLELLEVSIGRWAKRQHEPLALTRWRNRRANALKKMELVAQHFGTAFSTWVAYLHGEPLASIITLQSGVYTKCWKTAMNVEAARPYRANDLLHRLAIEEACNTGFRYYDMGESRAGSSLAGYKAKLGAKRHTAYRFRIERLPLHAGLEWSRRITKRALHFQDT